MESATIRPVEGEMLPPSLRAAPEAGRTSQPTLQLAGSSAHLRSDKYSNHTFHNKVTSNISKSVGVMRRLHIASCLQT